MEEPLVGGEGGKKNGRFERSCLIPTVAASVFGVLFFGCFIGLLTVAGSSKDSCKCDNNPCSSSSYTPPPFVSSSSSGSIPVSSSSSSNVEPSSSSSSSAPLSFTAFNATIIQRKCTSDSKHCNAPTAYTQCAWGPGKFFSEQVGSNGDILYRQFSTEKDGSVTICQQLGEHGNCYRQTSSDSVIVSIDGFNLLQREVSCQEILGIFINIIPNRSLDKCDYYTSTLSIPRYNQNVILQYVVESGTNYPVYRCYKNFEESTSSYTLYSSFEPGEPQDESKLQPFPGVHVYDFRNGEGDCSEQPTFTSRTYNDHDVHRKTFEREQALSSYLHLPPSPVGEFDSSRIRRTVVRDARDIPAQFDAREHWPDCADVIGTIVNQGPCGSCWAMSSSSVVSDRNCIANGVKLRLSPQFMVLCGGNNSGCQGGTTVATWEQLMYQGTVAESCIPFAGRDGSCPKQCYNDTMVDDVERIRINSYVLPWGDTDEARVQAIQSEIMENGPVQASFLVFSDWQQYQGGIYHRQKTAKYAGGHAVRIVGWGSEDGVDYWLVANSYSSTWGENGYFRIRRGNNECNIEEKAAAGLFTH